LGQKGKPYQPEYLHGDFGSDSPVAQEGVRALYEEILATENPKAQVFFNQWKILFGEVCGYDVENLSDKLKKLAEFYVVKGKPQPAPLLFAVHTYYAILIKLLAAEIVSFFNPWMPRQVERLQSASSSPAKLKRELEELERGGIFHQMGITNFLEGDLFSWYLAVWSEPIQALVRKMITKLDEYNPGTFSEEPAQSRDLLKKLYQQLFPKSVRHDLGEYYTPDWLAEHVLNELGYEGDPARRLLDPACGSGTFLVMAISRIRRWYDQNREKCAYDEGELLKKILANVIGFDLNPLAVMAARTNYLVAIKDLIRHVEGVEIPVYLCDSIMTPAEYGDLFTGGQGKVAKVPCSAMKPPHLLVPKEIAQSPKDVAKYADILETCVKNAYAPDEFLSRCRDEGLNIIATDAHLDLYKELVRLDKANKNGIWARIIKNNFAPLFVGRVDYVAGNPPWVNWQSLPREYRDDMKPLWESYGLFSLSGTAGRPGGGKKDLSMVFVYVSSDVYLHIRGRLGFVITQSVFKTKGAGDGFRRFGFEREGKWTYLKPVVVHDLSQMQVFEGASNRAAVFVCSKQSGAFEYPIPYVAWSGPSTIDQDEDLPTVLRNTKRTNLGAVPVERDKPTSPWLTISKKTLVATQKVTGRSAYKAYAGCCTWLNGVYWVQPVQRLPGGVVVVENMHDVGRIKVERVREAIEPDLLYPLIRGRGR
jgi:SAM-dependent methyltransferase